MFTIQRARPGRRAGGKCRKPTRANRKSKRCTRYKTVGRLHQNASAGANRKRFKGKIQKKKLKPGRYRARLTATDAAGNKSKAKRLKLTIRKR